MDIDLAPGIEVLEVVDRDFRRRAQGVSVPMGSFAAGETKTVLMRVRMSRAEAGRRPVADIRLQYRDLVRDEPADCDGQLVATVTEDPRAVSPIDPLVEARLARAETLSALTRANDLFSSGDAQAARDALEQSRGRIKRRRSSSTTRAPEPDRARLDADFESQLDALEEAAEGFGAAVQEAPTAPAASRSGRKAARQNIANADPFAL